MRTLAKNWLAIVLLLMVMGVGLMIYARKNRQRKEAEIKQIHDILDSSTGIDGVDIKTLIQSTPSANGFDALPLAKVIYSAKGYFNDDEEEVYEAFAGKNKAQIAAIYNAFVGYYGKDLDDYLKSFLNAEEFENVLRIIRQAV